jgi:hypothetical protein
MASTVVQESVVAKVEEVSKKGREGTYKAKVIKFNSKEYTVSKDDKEKVQVGQEYEFKLTKSEYNDKLYYWANLIQKEVKQDSQSQVGSEDFKKQVFSYLDSLSKENKIATIEYLLRRI